MSSVNNRICLNVSFDVIMENCMTPMRREQVERELKAAVGRAFDETLGRIQVEQKLARHLAEVHGLLPIYEVKGTAKEQFRGHITFYEDMLASVHNELIKKKE